MVLTPLASARAPLIALLTDFGLSDPYVGQMKAVLATAAPGMPVLDLCHGVAPHNLVQGAFFLAASLPWLPPDSVVAAVVDPGVGSARRLLLARWRTVRILAPDNGLLTLVLAGGEPVSVLDATPAESPVSATFHGRDVFAPLAAALASGADPASLVRSPDPVEPIRLPGVTPRRKGRTVTARVLSVDRFGNAVTSCDIAGFGLPSCAPSLRVPHRLPLVAVSCYAAIPPGAVGILAGSQGYLELAAPCASAAAQLGLSAGDPLVFDWPEEEGDGCAC